MKLVAVRIRNKTFCQGTEKHLTPPPREQEKKIFGGKLWVHPPHTVDMEMLEKLANPYLP